MKKTLGDFHNYGKTVELLGHEIYKPRSINWEQMFLSKSSKIRNMIDSECKLYGVHSPFESSPDIFCSPIDYDSGFVEVINFELFEENFNLTNQHCRSIGAIIALTFWFGMSDLHSENMAIGISNNNFVCFPLDIECIFDNFTHIKQTHLLPTAVRNKKDFGLIKLWNLVLQASVNDRVAIITSFISVINILNNLATSIFTELNQNGNVEKYKIRVVPRDTSFYLSAIRLGLTMDLYESELLQINRGDVPYFFRFPNETQIYFYSEAGIPLKADFSFNSFNLPSPLLMSSSEAKIKKMKTAIISASFLARNLGIETTLKSLSCTRISYENKIISIEEFGSEITFANC